MLLFAGLGNPGARHASNRHNVGFMAADAIHRRHSFSPWSKKFHAEIAEGRLGDEKILLIKPQTFMNLSGQAVGEALRFYKIDLGDLVVFYDELDLAPGKVRVKTGGGAGGHNGIRSIDGHCGQDYRRVRIGIGHPGIKEMVSPHVLERFHQIRSRMAAAAAGGDCRQCRAAGQARRQRLHEQAEPCRCRAPKSRSRRPGKPRPSQSAGRPAGAQGPEPYPPGAAAAGACREGLPARPDRWPPC